jgi:hypothetical protein
MIKTGCCELMEVFENTIDTAKKLNQGNTFELNKEFSDGSKELKEKMAKQIRNTWINGAWWFSYMLTDKLWKEGRLCSKCERVYQELRKEFDSFCVKQ